MSNKKRLSIDELAANTEKVLKGKELNANASAQFNEVLKKAAKGESYILAALKTKQRGSK